MARPRSVPNVVKVEIYAGSDRLYYYVGRAASGRKVTDSESETGYPTRVLAKREAHAAYPDAEIVVAQ